MDMTARDQGGGVALVTRDSSQPAFYPAPTTGAARVHLYVRDKDKGVDSAEIIARGKPGGEFSIPYAALANRNLLFATISYSGTNTPSVSDLKHAVWQELPITASMTDALGADAHVPTVTLAPTISKATEAAEEWVVFTPAPGADGSTVTDGEVRVSRADDLSVVVIYPVPDSPSHRIQQTPFDALIDYRWRNQSTEDTGDPDSGGRG